MLKRDRTHGYSQHLVIFTPSPQTPLAYVFGYEFCRISRSLNYVRTQLKNIWYILGEYIYMYPTLNFLG